MGSNHRCGGGENAARVEAVCFGAGGTKAAQDSEAGLCAVAKVTYLSVA